MSSRRRRRAGGWDSIVPDRSHVVIAGVSTRALAASAARAGYRVTAVDAFGDADLAAVAAVVPLRREPGQPFVADEAARAVRSVPADFAAYTSSFENHPSAVLMLARGRGRRLLGNPANIIRGVRDPFALARALRLRGFEVPLTRASAPLARNRRRWLLKPRHSGGGHGIIAWRPGTGVPRRAYLQERIAGTPGSIVFAADGRRAVPLGLTRQLVGLPAFGASGFRYCGSLLAGHAPLFPRQAELLARAGELAGAVTEAFGLRGLNTVDFIARRGVPVPIEVNPRYSASMELIERATGLLLFRVHAESCAGRLPRLPGAPAEVWGKAIVFARRATVIDDPTAWGIDLADVPHRGERIARGRPVCTVFARGRTGEACTARLARAARAVYAPAAVRGAA
jgi:predicted ATP-grasp superfamily ATP-dependent carboligase